MLEAGMISPVLELRDLSKTFRLPRKGGWFAGHIDHCAVREVSLTLPRNTILGLVGESGSGKSTTGLMTMRLLEPTSGKILIDGADITALNPAELKPFRRQMQIVFQDSYSALNPMMTLARIIAEPLHIHSIGTAGEQIEQALAMLDRVGLHRSYGQRYPHELSGGQRQRVAIARALILRPQVLVADEPTSALDVSVKAQIINLLLDLQQEMGLAILFISHDLSVVRSLTDRVAVMFNGRIVETAETETIFSDARHPYTQGLLSAIPVLNPRDRRRRQFLTADEIERGIPRLPGAGAVPGLVQVAPGHLVEAVAG
jgi:oligopeptide/dipeptide ABC transporter ATP-binding protein